MMLKVRHLWWLWWWAWSSGAAKLAHAATPCLPMVKLDGVSQNPQRPWKYVTWLPVQIKAKPIATKDCIDPPSNITYCWYVGSLQGGQLPLVSCDTVAQCKNQTGPVLDYAAYTVLRANYTVQLVAMLPGSQEPRRCVAGYFVVPPTPRVPFYFVGGLRTVVPHKPNLYLIINGGRDPDKKPDPSGSNIMKLDVSWECSTNDLKAKYWCDGDMQDVSPGIFYAVTIHQTDISPEYQSYALGFLQVKFIRPEYSYNFTAKAIETEWPYRTAETTVMERLVLNTGPSPILDIRCSGPCGLQRLLPTEELRLEAICGTSFCTNKLKIFYQWIVDQEGIGPVNLTEDTLEGKSSGLGLNEITILPGTFVAGAKINVRLLTNYYPIIPEEVNTYQKLYDEYKDFQKNKPS